ncbi:MULTISPECIES: primosomal protein N' [unclassified Polaromonas]|uniref:replication restart helicase PriA n=1 Tax=unclassified Polaromonas TaxID=2638319 RepID=UPI0018CA8CE3|nr:MULTISPECIES: primosomal protein N' [unclassified Polaromonas]MBG6072202.1 primosomal protein N' (replication factor Y) [Polaromonas sp. CG_9.7]MBG6114367.1 primosomal protein N' (replication factor Y) [Polaromonas sp. CG_9.2]MDH6182674.1 primosomal protein N' (replication factor Y) [Polaromonas sp. CG_23.6]
MSHWLEIVVATPAHSAIAGPLTYRSAVPLVAGTLVRVPFGRREVLGVVWDVLPDCGDMAEETIRDIAGALDGLDPLPVTWRKLVAFTAGYYQRSLGEVALAALPPQLRDLTSVQLARRLKRPESQVESRPDTTELIALSAQQACAIAQFDAETSAKQRPTLLFGATGSGKTEVYLRAAAQVLAQDPTAQVLVMVPEINLTPQLQARFEARFAHLGRERVVPMHSGLTPAQRLKGWLAAHSGQARLVLGTRMAVFASMPNLRLIVVDEEHDPSYKQQEGARYSARDLAVYRARLETIARQEVVSAGPVVETATGDLHQQGPENRLCPATGAAPSSEGSAAHEVASVGTRTCRVLLGSATPSLESWQATIAGRYQRLDMEERIGAGQPSGEAVNLANNGLPTVRRVDMNHQPRHCVIAPPLLAAICQRVARGEQSMIFLNRRGYAPVLACLDCDWKSDCPHCSAYRVFHKIDRTLRCHHCGFTERVPHACPSCGNIDIAPVGRGTERLEEHLAELLASVTRPDGEPVRIARIDADSTRLKGSLESQLARVHAGEVDVLVGTQMIAKGHDFRHITLVAAVNTDSALFSSDFRAPERLFSLMMQAAGRAGRDARHSAASEMWVQTFHPDHPLFEALKRHDYPAFATRELEERQAAGLAPFGFSALIRADAKTQDVAQGFLNAAAQAAQAQQLPGHEHVTPYPAVPMTIQRVANVERAQMLVESPSRKALQGFLAAWQPVLFETRRQAEFKSLVRWAIDVDPLAI